MQRLEGMLRLRRIRAFCGTTSAKLVSALKGYVEAGNWRVMPGSSAGTSELELLKQIPTSLWQQVRVIFDGEVRLGEPLGSQPRSRLSSCGRVQMASESCASRSARFPISSAFQVSGCGPLFRRNGLSLKPPSMSRFIVKGWSEYSEL